MTAEESAVFEQEMAVSPELRDDVKMVAWTIASIREVGHEQDQERIRRMKSAMPGDHKRMVSSVAATLIVGIMVAATISVPIIKHVTKSSKAPVTPSIEQPQSATPTPQPVDTLALPVATKPAAAEAKESSKVPEVKKEKVGKEKEEKKEKENTISSNSLDFSITPKSRMDENGTKYELYHVQYKTGTLILRVIIVNNNADRELAFDNPVILDDKGNSFSANIMSLNGHNTKVYSLIRTDAVEMVLHFKVKDVPHALQELRITDKNSWPTIRIKNITLH